MICFIVLSVTISRHGLWPVGGLFLRFRNNATFRGKDCHPMKILSLARKVLDSYKFIPIDNEKCFFKIAIILPKEINDSVVVIFCDMAFRAFDGKEGYGL